MCIRDRDYYFKNRLSKNSKELQQIMDKPWLADHIKNGHGPLCAEMCIRDRHEAALYYQTVPGIGA